MRRFSANQATKRSMAGRFDALLRPHVPTLYRSAYRFTRRREDAEDLVQDLLTRLYPRTPELERVEDLKPWLLRSLYHAFVDTTRKRQRIPEDACALDEEAMAAPEDPAQDVLQREQRLALNAAIEQLTPEQRAVVMLHLVEGYTLPELEQVLGVPIGTLKSRLHRAKAHLQDALEQWEPFRPDARVVEYGL